MFGCAGVVEVWLERGGGDLDLGRVVGLYAEESEEEG